MKYVKHYQEPRIEIGKTDGNIACAVRISVGNLSTYRKFEDSRNADPIISHGITLLGKFDRGELTSDQVIDSF